MAVYLQLHQPKMGNKSNLPIIMIPIKVQGAGTFQNKNEII